MKEPTYAPWLKRRLATTPCSTAPDETKILRVMAILNLDRQGAISFLESVARTREHMAEAEARLNSRTVASAAVGDQ